jgi:hypothetical protein
MKFGLGIVGGLLLAAAVANAHAAQQGRSIGGIGITVYEDANYRGENATFLDDVPSLNRYGLSRRISSLRVGPGEYWEGCEEPNYRGRCQVFSNTESNLGRVGWNDRIQSLRRARSGGGGGGGGGGRPPTGEGGRLELFDKRNFGGKSSALVSPSPYLGSMAGRSESLRLSGRWQICDQPEFRGNCRILSDNVPDLDRIGWKNRIQSARPR